MPAVTPATFQSPSVLTAVLLKSAATVTFTGTPYSEDPTYGSVIYANQVTPDADGATDVGLQLFDYPAIHVALANGVSYPVPIENGAGALKFIARMYTLMAPQRRVQLRGHVERDL